MTSLNDAMLEQEEAERTEDWPVSVASVASCSNHCRLRIVESILSGSRVIAERPFASVFNERRLAKISVPRSGFVLTQCLFQ